MKNELTTHKNLNKALFLKFKEKSKKLFDV